MKEDAELTVLRVRACLEGFTDIRETLFDYGAPKLYPWVLQMTDADGEPTAAGGYSLVEAYRNIFARYE